VYRIFENAGWIVYFEQLQGFNENHALEFARNLDGEQSMVRGMRIPVTEEIIAEVNHLPRTRERWFVHKTPLPTAKADFLREGEVVWPRGKGMALESLPHPWEQVAEFVKRYITCADRYKVVFNSDFILLSHLCHQNLINMPYYLLKALHNMAHYVRTSRVPLTCLTHHGLINLLIKWVEGLPNELQLEDHVELGNPPRGVLEENDEQVEIPQDD
jgi:hypothetical protein